MPFNLFPHSETQGKREHMKSVEEAMMVVEAFLEMSTLYTQLMIRDTLWLMHSLDT
jgi:hypothetical protein